MKIFFLRLLQLCIYVFFELVGSLKQYPVQHYFPRWNLFSTPSLAFKEFSLDDVASALDRWKIASEAPPNYLVTSKQLIVSDLFETLQASKYLKGKWFKTSNEVYRACKTGLVSLNGTKIFSTRKLNNGDMLELTTAPLDGAMQEESLQQQKNKSELHLRRLQNFTNSLFRDSLSIQSNLQLIYEDNHLAVVFKPAGLHTLQWIGTMKKQLFALDDVLPLILAPSTTLSSTENNNNYVSNCLPRPLPCHRLDSRVPGCVLVAKTHEALATLNTQFSDRVIKKEYAAMLAGRIDFQAISQSRHFNCFFASDGSENNNLLHIHQAVGGRTAHTILKLIRETPCNIYGTISHVALFPVTGRKHQLRQHCAWLGCPILGDDLYHNAAYYPSGVGRQYMISKAESGVAVEAYDGSYLDSENFKDSLPEAISRTGSTITGEEDSAGDDFIALNSDENQVDMPTPTLSIPYCMDDSNLVAEVFKPPPKVRKGIGILLMSRGIEFIHPVPLSLNITLTSPSPNIVDVMSYNSDSNRFSIRIKELKKFSKVFDKAAKGAQFETGRKLLSKF